MVAFQQVIAYLLETHRQVESLYQFDKDGKLSAEGEKGFAGRPLLDSQLVRAGQMLGDLWFSACQQVTENKHLIRKLTERNAANESSPFDSADRNVIAAYGEKTQAGCHGTAGSAKLR